MIFKSGAFNNLSNAQEAGAKIMAGLELGLSPMTAVRNIYFFDGSVTLSGPILAALIRQHREYDYKILGVNRDGAKVRFYRREDVDGVLKLVAQEPDVKFTRKMADVAGLLSKDNWKTYPEDMYVWRCIARGSRWHCPEVGKGTLYIVDEVKHGDVEDVEPIEEIKRDEAPDEERVEDASKSLPENVESVEGAPDFTEKEETTETKAPEPVPEEGKEKRESRPKKSNGSSKKSSAETSGASNEQPQTSNEGTPPANQMEPEAERIAAMVPSYVTVNAGAVTKEAAQRAKSMQSELRAMDPGNALLTKIQELRENVRNDFPNEEDADRVTLDQVLNHHISRIGGAAPSPESDPPAEEEGSREPPAEEVEPHAPHGGGHDPEPKNDNLPEPKANDVDVPGMPWFDTIGLKFRKDMEKTRDILQNEAKRRGVTPLKKRLDELKERFRQADPADAQKRGFEKAVLPYETIISMREALIEGQNVELEVFERVADNFFDIVSEYSNKTRREVAEEIVMDEARALESEFEALTIHFEDEEVEADAEGVEKGEDESEQKVPNIPLTPDFPKKEALNDAGITRTGEVAERLRSDTITSISGIGEAYAEQIADYLRSIADNGAPEELGF